MTFSVVARDEETGDIGIAVQSKFPAVGSLVPWIDLQAGGIATQALANIRYGSQGLELLTAGATADQVLKILLDQDPQSAHRQVGIVDLKGNAVAHTGTECYDWAGHLIGDGVTCQGNILIEGTVDAMMDTYLATKGDIAERLISALEAGQDAGGDSRGQQSANLIVHRENGGYGGGSDIWIDVRVDDHPQATSELRRVFELYSLTLLEREDPDDITKLEGAVIDELAEILREKDYIDKGGEGNIQKTDVLQGLKTWFHTNNFENKWRDDGYIWDSILAFIRS